MKITEVRINLITTVTATGRLKAVASVTIDDAIAIHDIKIIEKKEGGVFVANPARTSDASGVFHDIVHPINQAARDIYTKAILEAYEKKLQEQKQ